ncbi:BatD family protein [Kineobactrum salinum]|uniref:Protein BatD n=1 Tax=Kineobactrum salinum TaxID=2708301 RepID=A0A6C0U4Z1_9GAMM|nr:BatD family protein [Kineobactrum salinum]QIB67230.1 protein BatD [Kineobactrum salinum]
MSPNGNWIRALALLFVLVSSGLHAALEVAVDRTEIAFGDSLRLVITSTADEDLEALDLRALEADFEILQRNLSSSTSIINGQLSRSRQLALDISPRREGKLRIPAFSHAAGNTAPINIAVAPAATIEDGEQSVLFEAEVDRREVYVQGQLLLTLRIQQAINLEDRGISELQLDNAVVKPLEQNSFQRSVNGRPWLVHEVRYAIFPQQSGTLQIPSQLFSARESAGRRSVFDMGSRGRQLQRRSEPLNITVLPRPDSYPESASWLPARNITLEEVWSTPPEQLQAGESATRTLRLQGEGVLTAQLPSLSNAAQQGLKWYPDQPVTEERETSAGLVGLRENSAALVAVRGGSWTLPELRIPWWDTQAQQLRHAVLPAREIHIAANPAADPAADPARSPAPAAADTGTAAAQRTPLWPWQLLAGVCALGWLGTVIWYRRRAQAATLTATAPVTAGPNAARALRQLQAACTSHSAAEARRALLAWGQTQLPGRTRLSPTELALAFADEALLQAVADLERALYRDPGSAWDGTALLAAVNRLRNAAPKTGQKADALTLYPQGS